MTNYTIPTIFVATVIVAMAFAYTPVDNATAVHTTIQGTQLNDIATTSSADVTTQIDVSCANDFLVHYIVAADADGDDIEIDFDDDATAELVFRIDVDGPAGGVSTGHNGLSGTVSAVGGTELEIDATGGTPNVIVTGQCQSGDTVVFSSD